MIQSFKIIILVFGLGLLTISQSLGTENFTYLGEQYMSKGDHERAVHFFTMAIAADPNDTKAYLRRAKVYFFLDRDYEAMADYRKALEIDAEFVKEFMMSERRGRLSGQSFPDYENDQFRSF